MPLSKNLANASTVPNNAEVLPQITNWVPILEQAIFTPRKLKVVCVRAGSSGLILAHQRRKMDMESFIDLQIYEKIAGVRGTWYEKRYPGIACDVPARKYPKHHRVPRIPSTDFPQITTLSLSSQIQSTLISTPKTLKFWSTLLPLLPNTILIETLCLNPK